MFLFIEIYNPYFSLVFFFFFWLFFGVGVFGGFVGFFEGGRCFLVIVCFVSFCLECQHYKKKNNEEAVVISLMISE